MSILTGPTRRRFLARLGFGAAAIPLARVLAACGDNATAPASDGSGSASGWATGGTKSMTGKADYPNPFASGAPTTCALVCEATQGPCWDSQAETIQDISYGQDGLPARLYFQVVDDACTPIPNATVEVWHVAPTGKYSGNDTANEQVGFCTGNDAAYTAALWFRGKQVTDAHGLAYFDTCYPGWYASRTIHAHFIVTVNGQSTLTSQFVFDDLLNDDIIATQPIYKARGARDTTNTTDSVIPANNVAAYAFATQKLPDGALLAYKTIVIRANASETLCQIGGGGGPGGPPPDLFPIF